MAAPRLPTLEISLHNQFLASTTRSQIMSVDLHGSSVEEAKRIIREKLVDAAERGSEFVERIRFITGRGNHANTTDERGTLYLHFEEYLEEVKDKVFQVHKFDGYYEVDVRSVVRDEQQAALTEQSSQFLKNNIERIKARAAQGIKEDLAFLAICYQHGIGVPQSYSEMAKISQQLADAGDPIFQYELACSFFIGRGVKLNDEKARHYYQLSADQGYSLSELSLGNIYWRGVGIARNYQLAYPLLQKAALHGQGEAARKVGCFHAEGLGADCKVDYVEAIKWWKQAVKLKDATAAYNLYLTYLKGMEGVGFARVLANTDLAYRYLEHSAQLGEHDGEYAYGIALHAGKYGKNRCNEWLAWIEKAVDHGSADAMFFLFLHHLRGKTFTTQQIEIAKMYLKRAAEAGHIVAQLYIAVEFNFGFDEKIEKDIERRLLERDEKIILSIIDPEIKFKVINFLIREAHPKKAIKKGMAILRKLADENDVQAIQILWTVFLRDKNNAVEALKYLLRGAELGDPNSLCALGYFWQDGVGGKVDDKKSYDYFIKAAAKGNANSHNQLGQFFETGRFVKQNLQEAEKYFREAMRLDNPKDRAEDSLNVYQYAAANLGVMLLKDPARQEEAVKLLELSTEDGHPDAALLLAVHYRALKKTEHYLYYLSRADKMGNKQARPIVQDLTDKIGFDPKAYLEAFTFAPPVAAALTRQGAFAPKLAPDDKAEVYRQLARISDICHEKLDWKIAKEMNAWAYVSESLKKQLDAVDETWVKKTAAGKFVFVLDNVFKLDLATLLEKLEKHFLEKSKEKMGYQK